MMERELLLLGLLTRQEMHGYQLHEFIQSAMETCIDLKKPTAYALLDKMTALGWIQVETVQVGKRPARRVYSLTAAGQAQFETLLRQNLSHFTPTRFGDDIGIAFMEHLPPAEVRSLLTQRRAAMSAHLTRLEAIPSHAGGIQLLIEHQIRHLQTELTWLDEVLARLEIGQPHE